MAERSKDRETTLLFAENGVLMRGSFAKVDGWSISSDASIDGTRFAGEPFKDYDLDHQGWEFKCTVHEVGPEVRKMYLRQVEAIRTQQPRPRITITATTKYRDGIQPPFTQVCRNAVLKLDQYDVASGQFVKQQLSGFCSEAPELLGV